MTRDPMRLIAQGRKWCYTVLSDQRDEDGFIPSLVIEHERGHWPMTGGDDQQPWHFGKTFTEAQDVCAKVNAHRGVDETEAARIVATSMRAGYPR